jgi:hypothetical protein
MKFAGLMASGQLIGCHLRAMTPLPHSGRPDRRGTSEPQRADMLILYDFTTTAT